MHLSLQQLTSAASRGSAQGLRGATRAPADPRTECAEIIANIKRLVLAAAGSAQALRACGLQVALQNFPTNDSENTGRASSVPSQSVALQQQVALPLSCLCMHQKALYGLLRETPEVAAYTALIVIRLAEQLLLSAVGKG